MDKKKEVFQSIDQYISTFPEDIQLKLKRIREIIQKEAPEATEKISYQMPTFYLSGNLVHFAAFKNHIGFYPTPSGVEAFQKKLEKYQTSKGAIQFPLDQELPVNLIREIVQYRLEENKVKSKKTKQDSKKKR